MALFEKADYGSGTTSGSTRLIHGGLRYLEMFDFRLVRLDLREREILLRIAPHLVRPLEFLLPFYGLNPFHRTRMRAGLFLYDLLSYDKSLPSRKHLTRDEVIKREPHLSKRGLKGAAAYSTRRRRCPSGCASKTSRCVRARRPCLQLRRGDWRDPRGDGDAGVRTVGSVGSIGGGRVTGVRVRDR